MDGHRLAPLHGRAPLSCPYPAAPPGQGSPTARELELLPEHRDVSRGWEKEIRRDFLWTMGKHKVLTGSVPDSVPD